MSYDSTKDTKEHIYRVNGLLQMFGRILTKRGEEHDQSKLVGIQKETFDRVTPQLKELDYGSDEYRAMLAEMKPALDDHYAKESHHPEHYENGIDGMNLFDLVEMFVDWKAASERHENGDIRASIDHNKRRFNMSPQLASIFRNTVDFLDARYPPGVYIGRWPGYLGRDLIFAYADMGVYADRKDDHTVITVAMHGGSADYKVTEPGWHYIHKLLMHMKKHGEGEMVWKMMGITE